ncbi:hypothetical protein [Ramlibacter humi]|uniref:Uncharacterized protein n=1 Tax=Ramlibacter humi TaxID=2530451 RepID=A0A4Z0CA87_9BURK|nr:hypothetical protein [Ramlibacter humi]TFZ07914.1 hypothetical protein EZ216_01755 [Ramlibacter humi]
MEDADLQKMLAEMAQNLEALKENQFALVAQVQVLQAALASALMHHPDRKAVLGAFERYMQVAKDSAPNLAQRMQGLEAGMLSLLGKHQA